MELVGHFDSPLIVLSALPWVLLFAWVARRLLGARNLSTRSALLTGIAGYAAGLLLASSIAGGVDEPGFVLAGTVFTIIFTMVAIVGLELFIQRRTPSRLPTLPSIPRPLRAVQRRIRISRRFLEVTRIAVANGLGGVLGRKHEDEVTLQEMPGGPARWTRKTLEDAGGMFVKLGQLLSTRVDLMPLEATREFARLQEEAAPADPQQIRQVIEDELGAPVDEVFAEFDWDPLATASLAQVYAARLPTGESVVVKVQRPGIAEVVRRDLAIVRRLAKIIESRTEWGRTYGVSALAEEFATRLHDELDYQQEATHTDEIAAAVEQTPQLHVPKIWNELSTSRLRVRERLDGTSVGKLTNVTEEQSSLTEQQRRQLADALLRAQLEPMLTGDRFHADPHPGNIFLLDDGRLGLLDFGATGRLDAYERASVTSILVAIDEGDPTILREAVFEVADVPRELNPAALDRTLARFMAEHLGDNSTPDAAALSELLQIFGRHGISLPPSTSTMFRALVTLEGTLNQLVPGYLVIDAAGRLGQQMADEAVQFSSAKETGRKELLKLLPLLRRAPRHLERIATLIEQGELRGKLSLFSERRDVEVVKGLVNRVVLAACGATLGIVSALLLTIEAGPAISPDLTVLHLLGYIGLGAGAVLLLRVVLAVLRDEQATP